jgi:hypothetical protein
MCKNFADVWRWMCNKHTFDWLGVAFGPGFTLIRAQALAAGPVSASIPNAEVVWRETRSIASLHYPPSVGKTASGESGQNNGGLVRGKGIGNFAEARGKSEREWGKRFQPVVMPGLQGKGLVRQRSLFVDLIYSLRS